MVTKKIINARWRSINRFQKQRANDCSCLTSRNCSNDSEVGDQLVGSRGTDKLSPTKHGEGSDCQVTSLKGNDDESLDMIKSNQQPNSQHSEYLPTKLPHLRNGTIESPEEIESDILDWYLDLMKGSGA